ncbi:hypothetical protein GH714_000815 [Hevea brasiliensis]|uniref:MPN domain-containing protein n=1 Tax=Hevea brasiliensis TaxID=3981 RepID=A0A6A6NFD1_HEVBR|nr:hypothetical protein GH714_000815 [Hevea brasiliensis]
MAGGELKYDMSQNAYIKLVLHALKHRSSAVNGVLLVDPTTTSSRLPTLSLFHNHLGLLPPLEISLIMIEEYYIAQGLGIVGYFHANERFDDAELDNVAKNIGDHIYRYFPQAAILLLYTRDASKNWKLAGSDGGSRLILKEPAANIVLLDFISSQKWQDVVDFDDHLDDITKDWLNPDLFK